jgi:thiol:disulfide interchange protein DsbC
MVYTGVTIKRGIQVTSSSFHHIRALALSLGLLCSSGGALAAAGEMPQSVVDAVVTKLRALRPDLEIAEAGPSTIPGMVAIELRGGTSLTATADGRYLIAGDVYEMGDELVNVAEAGRDAKRRELLASIRVEDMAVFPATGNRRAVLTVFTDLDCGYCRKLHQEVPQLNQMGVEIRYLAYPRAGIGSPSYDKLVTAWCSKDRNDAITRMKQGEVMPKKTCTNPVAAEYELGHLAGLQGTPAIVLEDGRMLPGYMTADELAQVLGI